MVIRSMLCGAYWKLERIERGDMHECLFGGNFEVIWKVFESKLNDILFYFF